MKGRQVTIRKEYANLLPKGKLLSEEEWRRLGIQMSYGWTNYCAYKWELVRWYEVDRSRTSFSSVDPLEPTVQRVS